MSIQSIGSIQQTMGPMRTDFQNFSAAAKNLQSALNSANGTQSASSSTSTMTTALNNVLNDLSYFTQGQTGDAGGNNDGNIVS